MDEYSGKRAVNGLVVSKKSGGLLLRETPNRNNNAQFCSRVGCSGRLSSTRSTQTEKPRPPRPPIRPSCSSKEIIGSSSRTLSSVTAPRKSNAENCRKLSSHLDSDSSETSSVRDEPELIDSPVKIQRGGLHESRNPESSVASSMEVGSSSVASNTRSRRNLHQRSILGNRASSTGPSSSLGSKGATIKAPASSTRYGLRNLRCNSISDIVPSNCSSSDSSVSKRETVKKRNCEGESSSAAKGKRISGSSSGQSPGSNHVSVSDLRRGKNMPSNRDNGVALVRTRRPISSQTRARISNQGNGNSSSTIIPDLSNPDISIDISSSGSSHLSSSEASSGRSNSYIRSGSRNGRTRGSLTIDPPEGYGRSLGSRDGLRRFNVNGIAEVLLALERIENDEELAYEQILALESNWFLNGMNFYDQHRDMRLDIDNMSYEELLALEERMGNVSTALTEEALSDCLEHSIYELSPVEDVTTENNRSTDDDVKCCICQEEYDEGDEIGRLRCEHWYHTVCIQQWLRLKNWCPICKTSAIQSTSSSSSSSPSP